MRRIAIGAALTGVGVLVARALAPRLHARLLAACERMFEQMPDNFPPKRMMRGIEEIHANSARTLELLEERTQVGEAEPLGEVSSTKAVASGLNETNSEERVDPPERGRRTELWHGI